MKYKLWPTFNTIYIPVETLNLHHHISHALSMNGVIFVYNQAVTEFFVAFTSWK